LGKLRVFLYFLFAFLFIASPASADPITDALAAWLVSTLVIDATVAAVIATVVVDVAVSLTLTYIAKALSPSKKSNTPGNSESGTDGPGQSIQAGGALPRSFIVGTYETPGKLIYANTYGTSGKTPNAFLTLVISLADIPVTALTKVHVSNSPGTYGSGSPDANLGYAIPEYNNGQDNLWVKFYDGTQVAVDSFLNTTYGSDPNFPYDSNRVGTGCAYAIVTVRDEPKLFTSIPTFKFEMQGIKLYDPRLDTTVGGSGSQRWATPSTWAWSENPVVIIYNILRGVKYSGNWFYGLQNLDASRLPTASWFAAMNACDTLVSKNGGGTEKQYRCGGEISVDLAPADVIDELLKGCNGRLAEVGGIYKIGVGASTSSILSFTDDDILVTEQQSYIPFPSQTTVINGLTATYPAPDQAWTKTNAPPRYNSTLETADGQRFVTNVDYNTVPYLEQVQRLMASAILEARKFRRHSFILPPQCFVLEPNDIVSYTSTRNGYSSKLFRVERVTDNNNLDIAVTLVECDPADYNWTPGTDYIARTNGPLVIATQPPLQAIQSWTATAVTLSGAGTRQDAAIQLGWTTSGITDVRAVQYEVRLHATLAVVSTGEVEDWQGGSIIISQNILSATQYDVRGRYIPYSTRDTSWTSLAQRNDE
jgi:hypothetical protein